MHDIPRGEGKRRIVGSQLRPAVEGTRDSMRHTMRRIARGGLYGTRPFAEFLRNFILSSAAG